MGVSGKGNSWLSFRASGPPGGLNTLGSMSSSNCREGGRSQQAHGAKGPGLEASPSSTDWKQMRPCPIKTLTPNTELPESLSPGEGVGGMRPPAEVCASTLPTPIPGPQVPGLWLPKHSPPCGLWAHVHRHASADGVLHHQDAQSLLPGCICPGTPRTGPIPFT